MKLAGRRAGTRSARDRIAAQQSQFLRLSRRWRTQNVKFDDRGLVPCIVQAWDTGEVLTLAYMNAEALRAPARPARCISGAGPGRSSGTRARHPGTPRPESAPLRLRRRRAAGARGAGRARLPYGRADLLSPRGADRRPDESLPELERTIALAQARSARRFLHGGASRRPARIGKKVQEEARRWRAPRARSPTSGSPRRPPTSSTTYRAARQGLSLADAERVLDERRSRTPDGPPASPTLETLELELDYNLVPLRETYLETARRRSRRLWGGVGGGPASCLSRPSRVVSAATRSSATARARFCAGRSATPATPTSSPQTSVEA